MSDVDYRVNDFDNHYYEAIDAFTRHLDPRLGRRIIQWAEIDGRKYHVIGGKVSHEVVNPTFDPIAKAGAMSEYFRGNPSGRNPLDYLREREPIRPEYRDRETRIQVMDEQGLDKIWLYPTLGMIYEQLLKHDPEGVGIMFRAFNRWVEEDWGYNYENRIGTLGTCPTLTDGCIQTTIATAAAPNGVIVKEPFARSFYGPRRYQLALRVQF